MLTRELFEMLRNNNRKAATGLRKIKGLRKIRLLNQQALSHYPIIELSHYSSCS
jgi:hypothetical protein